ncbi:UNVERIFIED_CONTAM: hypothetical protein Slati_2338900 [Sesamum latifolium]|uniref:Pentatricopeptide repeat-containing protein n=1 Tax=Sesamum latifolium TaxID=2727402 RepID=A0AAW2WA04_9LAMI
MIDDALQLLAKMIDNGISPNIITFNLPVQGLGNFGRWKDVKGLTTEIVGHKISSDVVTFNILADACCKDGKVKKDEDVVEIIEEAKYLLIEMEKSRCAPNSAI